jgi:uncharacterized membrane protein
MLPDGQQLIFGRWAMRPEFAVVFAVMAVIGGATWLMSGTGILDGFSGMFLRVLLGFSLLFLGVRIFCSRKPGAPQEEAHTQ